MCTFALNIKKLIADSTLVLPVNLNHFRLLRVVGKGAFGKVRIVERKDTGLTFALKYIRKDEGWALVCSACLELSIDYKCSSCSGAVRERQKYNSGATDARTPQSSFSLQLAL
jgi:serine/threonine protein kinase